MHLLHFAVRGFRVHDAAVPPVRIYVSNLFLSKCCFICRSGCVCNSLPGLSLIPADFPVANAPVGIAEFIFAFVDRRSQRDLLSESDFDRRGCKINGKEPADLQHIGIHLFSIVRNQAAVLVGKRAAVPFHHDLHSVGLAAAYHDRAEFCQVFQVLPGRSVVRTDLPGIVGRHHPTSCYPHLHMIPFRSRDHREVFIRSIHPEGIGNERFGDRQRLAGHFPALCVRNQAAVLVPEGRLCDRNLHGRLVVPAVRGTRPGFSVVRTNLPLITLGPLRPSNSCCQFGCLPEPRFQVGACYVNRKLSLDITGSTVNLAFFLFLYRRVFFGLFQNDQAVDGAFIALFGGFFIPCHGGIPILFHAVAFIQHITDGILSDDVTFIGGGSIKFRRFFLIEGDTVAAIITIGLSQKAVILFRTNTGGGEIFFANPGSGSFIDPIVLIHRFHDGFFRINAFFREGRGAARSGKDLNETFFSF